MNIRKYCWTWLVYYLGNQQFVTMYNETILSRLTIEVFSWSDLTPLSVAMQRTDAAMILWVMFSVGRSVT
jgi:hypothetical protein